MSAEHGPSRLPRTGLKDKTRDIANAVKSRLFPEPIPREEILRGLGVLADQNAMQLMGIVNYDRYASVWSVMLKGQVASIDEIKAGYSTLSSVGLIEVTDESLRSELLHTYHPTKLGDRVYREARRIR